MARLEDVTVGALIEGINGNDPVTIIAARWCGTAVLEVTYKASSGRVDQRLLYREDEPSINMLENKLPWSFDADGALLRLVSEAYRINLAHIFDPYLAVHTSAIEPLPHQISAVYEEMIQRLPLRYILADDPGAGKTIMTGLLLKELIIRGDLKRCLIVTPGSLAEQWQDELRRKFHLHFEILTNDRFESSVSGNIFTEIPYCIARLDKLARDDVIKEKLKVTDWDLIVCDEAHKMSATIWGGEIKYTERFKLGKLLSNITRHFLLLTATPHNGKEEDFQLFLSLVDSDRFEGVTRSSNQSIDVSDVMRRLVKEELLKFDGTPLFPERIAYTINYNLSPLEAKLYMAVTEYVQEEFNRADQLNSERKTTVGFALTILQRRLASSPEAIYQSIHRRRERLENRLAEEKLGRRADAYQASSEYVYDLDDIDDVPCREMEEYEEEIVDQASASSTVRELEAEIATLKNLERMANAARTSGQDRKWDELSKLLQDNPNMFGTDGKPEKLIIFTEHRDTLNYLTSKIRSTYGRDEVVVNIHGGMLRDERRKVEELFKQDKEVRILVATDAAGEGINLQRAHLMVNYDLPWNPNRLEQRFGRIHRIGQTEVCHLWNLVSKETREGLVFLRLLEKLEQERSALGGKVFDILGKLTFDNKPLRELLLDAIRYGNQPEVRDRLNQVVDKSLDREALRKLLAERALTEDTMDVHRVMAIKETMERIEAHKLQPHFIEAFFLEAFASVGGVMRKRESGRYEITSVPFAVRNRDMQIGFGEPVLTRYERVCFDKDDCSIPGQPPAVLLSPGHPLLEATIDLIRERHNNVLKQGAILVDETDEGEKLRILFYMEDAIQDGKRLDNGNRRIISKQVHFVELDSDELALNAGYAPYLDYRPIMPEEEQQLRPLLHDQAWLHGPLEEMAANYAIDNIVQQHLMQVREHIIEMADKIGKAVKDRLTSEIQYWDFRAAELKQKEAVGKPLAKVNSEQAARRAEELEGRLQKRLAELESEKQVSALPPMIIGGALIVPKGLLNKLAGVAQVPGLFGQDTKVVELMAIQAVLAIEKKLGYQPVDVSSMKCGYDIESKVPQEKRDKEGCLRFIEVKGRAKGATTVTVSKNEILTAFNKPDEFILAVVEVDGSKTHTIYLKRPFRERPDFAATSINYNIAELVNSSTIDLQ